MEGWEVIMPDEEVQPNPEPAPKPSEEPEQGTLDVVSNYIVAFSPKQITGVTLVPKRSLRQFIAMVPQHGQFTSIHAIAGEQDLVHNIPGGVALRRIEWFYPRYMAQRVIDDLHQSWRGKTGAQIDADINAVVEGMRNSKKLWGY